MKTVTRVEMQALEQRAFADGATTESLMEQAVSGMLSEWEKRFPKPGQVYFFCGKGHNGNDGLWLARELQALGWKTTVVLSHQPEERKTVSSSFIQEALQKAYVWPDFPSFSTEKEGISITVDALLGTGVSGEPRGVYADILAALAKGLLKSNFNVSVDCPSGLDTDGGDASAHAFRADLTFSLGRIKEGLLRDKARPWVGRLVLIPLSLPQNDESPLKSEYFGPAEARLLARHLSPGGYKHQRGTLGVWAGSAGMEGAAVLSARSGLRAGAGLVKLCSAASFHAALISTSPEIMTSGFSFPEIPEALLKTKAWVLGPGIGLSDENFSMLKKLLANAPCPVVLDADALTLSAQDPEILKHCPQPVILTPHHGELAKLIGHTFEDRNEAGIEWLNVAPSSILVAKGPNTLVMEKKSPVSFNASGNPGMATAGMGDVLSGLIGSLLAQGYPPRDAARLGVYWHGLAADLAVCESSEQCLNASDLFTKMGPAWKEIIA